jgi:phosphate transport system ATP-binding protein
MSTPTSEMTPKPHVPEGRGEERDGYSEQRPTASAQTKISVSNLDFFYGRAQALYNISLEIPERMVMAFIGPSGCGKSTFLRTLNRMNDTIPGTRAKGSVQIDGQDIYAPGTDVVELRRKVGMVFQKSNPFPKSIFDNVAYGLRVNRMASAKADLHERVEKALTDAALWNEVKDRLKSSALGLSGGHRHRHAQHAAGGARL